MATAKRIIQKKIEEKPAPKKIAPKKGVKKGVKEICFVIMPFGTWFDSYYNEIYKPAIIEAGLLPKRADDLYRPSSIVQDIWNYTKQSKLVLADLTDKNPNVFYELGLAHSLAKPAILITNSMSDIPFDLRALRVLDYDKNDANWGVVLKAKIVTAIKETLESPITAVLPAFLNIKDADKTKITITEGDFINLKKDIELLRNELRVDNRNGRRVLIPPTEAAELIRIYIKKGFSKDSIIKILSDRGISRLWVANKYEKIKGSTGFSSNEKDKLV